jgi:hypothetical protein
MKPFLNYKSLTIPANGSVVQNITGSVFSCKGCSVPSPGILVIFDDGEANPCAAGWTFNQATVALATGVGQSQFQKITLTNTTSTPAIVSFFVGNYAVSYNAPDNRVASTYAKGNLGLSGVGPGLTAGTGSQIYTVNGISQTVQLSNYMIVPPGSGSLMIYGTDNGHQRKLVILSCAGTGTLCVYDGNGLIGFGLNSSTLPVVAIETDSTLKIGSVSGSPLLTIMEIYFAQP